MSADTERPSLIRPGLFGEAVMADTRRYLFDAHNEQILGQGVPVAAVFAGDSITEGWALDAFFRSPEGLVVNRGIGGDITPYLRRRFEADVLQLRPRLLVLKIGVNNTWALDQWADPTLLQTPDQIEEQITSDVEAMVGAATDAGIIVALCSILPVDNPTLVSTPVRNELIIRTNDRLRQIAETASATYVDYHAAMVGDDGGTLRPGMADDGLHPHISGYRVMARVLLDTLSSAGIRVMEPAMAAGHAT